MRLLITHNSDGLMSFIQDFFLFYTSSEAHKMTSVTEGDFSWPQKAIMVFKDVLRSLMSIFQKWH